MNQFLEGFLLGHELLFMFLKVHDYIVHSLCLAHSQMTKNVKKGTYNRYLKKSRLLKFVMCQLLALPFPGAFLQWPLTVLSRETRQAVRAINQSIYL